MDSNSHMNTQLIPPSLYAYIMKRWEIELLVYREEQESWKTAFMSGRLQPTAAPARLWVAMGMRWREEAGPAAPGPSPCVWLKPELLYFHLTYITMRVRHTLRIRWDRDLARCGTWMTSGQIVQCGTAFVIRKQHITAIKTHHYIHVDQRKG